MKGKRRNFIAASRKIGRFIFGDWQGQTCNHFRKQKPFTINSQFKMKTLSKSITYLRSNQNWGTLKIIGVKLFYTHNFLSCDWTKKHYPGFAVKISQLLAIFHIYRNFPTVHTNLYVAHKLENIFNNSR